MNETQTKGNEDRISFIMEEIEKLSTHIKTYSVGSYPVFYLQLHSILKVQDILEMRLSDVYECVHGNVYVKDQIICDEKEVGLSGEDRKNLAWYAMQRIKVRNTEEEQMKEMYLCVNKQGKPLQKQVYRKMLERSSSELDLSRVYNCGYLRSLYGYLEIAYGRKTIEDVATEYQVERYYLLNRIFKGMSIEYDSQLLNEVANIDEADLQEDRCRLHQ